MGMTYAGTGVNYDVMDPFKRRAQAAAKKTVRNITRLGFRVRADSYGESAFLIEQTDNQPCIMAHVEEGLGTKNLVADAERLVTGRSFYANIAQDTVAMIVNDLVTLGALPLSVAMHLAVGASEWFDDEMRSADLVEGWKNSCDLARCAWGGGETPTLKDIVGPLTFVISGSAIGVVKPVTRLIRGNIRDGDAIVLVRSNGIHANGLTLARRIAENLPGMYNTKLEDGRTYGETLLDPTHLYVGLVEECFKKGVDIHYAVNITGHGWRKLMRSPLPFTYVIDTLPPQLPIFEFLQKYGGLSDEEAYGNLNMGAGFALYVPEKYASGVADIALRQGLRAFLAGHIERGEKQVIINPKKITFRGDSLGVR